MTNFIAVDVLVSKNFLTGSVNSLLQKLAGKLQYCNLFAQMIACVQIFPAKSSELPHSRSARLDGSVHMLSDEVYIYT